MKTYKVGETVDCPQCGAPTDKKIGSCGIEQGGDVHCDKCVNGFVFRLSPTTNDGEYLCVDRFTGRAIVADPPPGRGFRDDDPVMCHACGSCAVITVGRNVESGDISCYVSKSCVAGYIFTYTGDRSYRCVPIPTAGCVTSIDPGVVAPPDHNPMHPADRLKRIISSASASILEGAAWNACHPDDVPLDISGFQQVLSRARDALIAWADGNGPVSGAIMDLTEAAAAPAAATDDPGWRCGRCGLPMEPPTLGASRCTCGSFTRERRPIESPEDPRPCRDVVVCVRDAHVWYCSQCGQMHVTPPFECNTCRKCGHVNQFESVAI